MAPNRNSLTLTGDGTTVAGGVPDFEIVVYFNAFNNYTSWIGPGIVFNPSKLTDVWLFVSAYRLNLL
jgi:hypothetical protein